MTFALSAPRKRNRTPELPVRNLVCSWLQLQESRRIAWGTIHDSVGIFDPVKKVYRKSNSPYRKVGAPDWVGSWRGRSLWIEFKAPEVRNGKGTITRRKGSLSQEQREFLMAAAERNGIVIVARCLEDVTKVLKIEDDMMGLKWTGPLHPPVPAPESRQGRVLLNGQFMGFADTIEELQKVIEPTRSALQTDITDFIKPSKDQP